MSVLPAGNGGLRYRNIGNVAGYTVVGFDSEGKTILNPILSNTHDQLAADIPGGHTTHHVFVSVSAQSAVDPGQDAYDGRTYLFTAGGLAIPPHISTLELLEAGRQRADQDLRLERRRLQVEADRVADDDFDASSRSASGSVEEGGGTQVVIDVDEDGEQEDGIDEEGQQEGLEAIEKDEVDINVTYVPPFRTVRDLSAAYLHYHHRQPEVPRNSYLNDRPRCRAGECGRAACHHGRAD
jgi:hypothetical protein